MLQGFATNLLLPLYYASLGMRTHLGKFNREDMLMMILVSFLSFIPKIVCTVAISYFYRMLHGGFTLGVLMNTKGLIVVVAMSLGRDHTVMNEDGFAIMLFTIFIMTIATSPIVNFMYRRTKKFLPSQHRVLQNLKPDDELRILTCIHEVQTVAGITALLEISHASRRSPICVFALQLMQLKKHNTALLIVHGAGGTSSESISRVDGQIDQLIAAFKNLEHRSPMLSVQLLTDISPYGTMHEDVCSLAEEKLLTIHNNMEEMHPAYKDVNSNTLATARCIIDLSLTMEGEAEKQADDILVNEFRHKVQNDVLVVYTEEMSSNGAETVKTITSLGQDFDLYVVGRGLGFFSALKGGLDEWSDCPELGSIGDLLVTSDFSLTASILVVQQHVELNPGSSTQGNSIL
ncbi:hypothetical protein K7X08_032640 [Anisodus acutangulus]|uniref:Cation/H+ exchanger transmembrane domain-containing protein n=1 Tax=Anisodus acutangulus TaxID=402998 RepID=A0A9Q1LZ15_9SOLA|nr:hypothetical protein K7X08_032640 [Anisodus acutangulus]